MFSAEDLKCVESEIIDILIKDETAYFSHLPPLSGNSLPNDLIASAEFNSLAELEKEPQWLQQTKQELEALWNIESDIDQDKDSPQPSTADPISPKE